MDNSGRRFWPALWSLLGCLVVLSLCEHVARGADTLLAFDVLSAPAAPPASPAASPVRFDVLVAGDPLANVTAATASSAGECQTPEGEDVAPAPIDLVPGIVRQRTKTKTRFDGPAALPLAPPSAPQVEIVQYQSRSGGWFKGRGNRRCGRAGCR